MVVITNEESSVPAYKVFISIKTEDGVVVFDTELGPFNDEELFIREQVNGVKLANVINDAYGVPFDELY